MVTLWEGKTHREKERHNVREQKKQRNQHWRSGVVAAPWHIRDDTKTDMDNAWWTREKNKCMQWQQSGGAVA
ncbi:hypothetical protein Syun_000789 [Stephania yunnanensis]|uniref:Uncharacterized protein n=1 Tax=Stephania yunnanensis TaxID=152371 RepID=A0AAP0LI62_9MAGN